MPYTPDCDVSKPSLLMSNSNVEFCELCTSSEKQQVYIWAEKRQMVFGVLAWEAAFLVAVGAGQKGEVT